MQLNNTAMNNNISTNGLQAIHSGQLAHSLFGIAQWQAVMVTIYRHSQSANPVVFFLPTVQRLPKKATFSAAITVSLLT